MTKFAQRKSLLSIIICLAVVSCNKHHKEEAKAADGSVVNLADGSTTTPEQKKMLNSTGPDNTTKVPHTPSTETPAPEGEAPEGDGAEDPATLSPNDFQQTGPVASTHITPDENQIADNETSNKQFGEAALAYFANARKPKAPETEDQKHAREQAAEQRRRDVEQFQREEAEAKKKLADQEYAASKEGKRAARKEEREANPSKARKLLGKVTGIFSGKGKKSTDADGKSETTPAEQNTTPDDPTQITMTDPTTITPGEAPLDPATTPPTETKTVAESTTETATPGETPLAPEETTLAEQDATDNSELPKTETPPTDPTATPVTDPAAATATETATDTSAVVVATETAADTSAAVTEKPTETPPEFVPAPSEPANELKENPILTGTFKTYAESGIDDPKFNSDRVTELLTSDTLSPEEEKELIVEYFRITESPEGLKALPLQQRIANTTGLYYSSLSVAARLNEQFSKTTELQAATSDEKELITPWLYGFYLKKQISGDSTTVPATNGLDIYTSTQTIGNEKKTYKTIALGRVDFSDPEKRNPSVVEKHALENIRAVWAGLKNSEWSKKYSIVPSVVGYVPNRSAEQDQLVQESNAIALKVQEDLKLGDLRIEARGASYPMADTKPASLKNKRVEVVLAFITQ